MRVTVLGCGTSSGVPVIGCRCAVCTSNEPRNRRSRASILIETEDKRLLVDCGPDMREQLLSANVDRIDGVIVTHEHADHCHGIDELRRIAQILNGPVPLYARADTLDRLQSRFGYIFKGTSFYSAVAEPIQRGSGLALGGATLHFVDQPHGNITSLGMRIEEGGRSAIYAIDFNDLTGEMRKLYQGADVWIADCLSRRPHPTHTHLDAVLAWAEEMGVGKLYLSHMNNSMDYQTLVAELPGWAAPAHDGLEIELR